MSVEDDEEEGAFATRVMCGRRCARRGLKAWVGVARKRRSREMMVEKGKAVGLECLMVMLVLAGP